VADQPTVLAVVSDTHCGGTVSLMGPNPVPLDDGPTVNPGPINVQLYNHFRRAVDWAVALAARYGARLAWHVNGDLVEGDHHATHQIISRHKGAEFWVARDALTYLLDTDHVGIGFTRGTESHVGKGGSAEEGFAKGLAEAGHNVRQHPDTGQYTAYHWDLSVGGSRVWLTHHGAMGRTPRTRASLVALRAGDVVLQSHLDDWRREMMGEPPEGLPDVFVASHFHTFACSAPEMYPTQWVQTPCYTFRNAHAQKVASTSLPDIGMIALVCIPGARPRLETYLWKPPRSSTCKV
jgi:hypothetical protein